MINDKKQVVQLEPVNLDNDQRQEPAVQPKPGPGIKTFVTSLIKTPAQTVLQSSTSI